MGNQEISGQKVEICYIQYNIKYENIFLDFEHSVELGIPFLN